MTQRALMIGALSTKPLEIYNPLDCDDSRALINVLRTLGVVIEIRDQMWRVKGPIREPASIQPIHCGQGGTTLRFSSALILLLESPLVLDGHPSLQKRPITPLVEALRQLGVEIDYLGKEGYPPIHMLRKCKDPIDVDVDISESSQFASALFLVAPLLPRGLHIRLLGQWVSKPYLIMTLEMMKQQGARWKWLGKQDIQIFPGGYAPKALSVEVDWSSAAYVMAAAFLIQKEIKIQHLQMQHSIQGDAKFLKILEDFKRGVHAFYLRDTPDLIGALAAMALFRDRPTWIRDVAHIRLKECDRLAVLAQAFRQLGATVQAQGNGLLIHPLPRILYDQPEIWLDPHDDHRMAMTFGLIQLRLPQVKILHPECVSKSFPNFWAILQTLKTL